VSNAVVIAAIVLLLGGGLVWFLATRKRKRPPVDSMKSQAPAAIPAAEDEAESVASANPSGLLEEARHHYYCTAFSVTKFDAPVLEVHHAVIEEVGRSLATIAEQERLLPRRPMLMPQLLRALNDPESTREEMSAIILQDPVLAADVLKIANSPYYRVSREPVDSIDRAIVLLGTEGLKSVVAASILQPVFRQPRGPFDAFATTLWDLAMRTATAVGIYAKQTRLADPLTAQLLGLLSALGPLALFRITAEIYRNHPELQPRAEVFAHLIDTEGDAVSGAIAAHWELPETFVLALSESRGTGALEALSPLGKALEAGRCCAFLSLAPASNKRSIEANKAAMSMGLQTTAFDAVWRALNAAKSTSK
jgi:HD-like signal output (HDOD) protein